MQQAPACLSTVMLTSAENDHSQIRKQQGSKSPTVLAYNYRATGGKNAPCLLPSTSFNFAYGYTCPGLYFQNPKGAKLSVRVAFTTRIFSNH
jgi:hypothetical protein